MYKRKGGEAAAAVIERYMGPETGLPALRAIGRSVQKVARGGLALHHHPGFEICLFEQGAVDWVIGGRPVSVGAGEVFFTPPEAVHGNLAGQVQPCVLCWLQADPGKLPDRRLAGRLQAIGAVHWRDTGGLMPLHAAMLAECRRPGADSPALLQALLTAFLIRVARQGEAASAAANFAERAAGGTGAGRGAWPAALARAAAAIDAAPARIWRVGALTRLAGVGRSRLHALFEQFVGQTPAGYALRLRLRAAQAALTDRRRPQLTMAAIAAQFGFSSSQHFATAFRAQFGLTPTAYRRGAF